MTQPDKPELRHTPTPWHVIDLRESKMREMGWKGPSIDRILITNATGAKAMESESGSVIARIQFDNRTEPLGEVNLADAALIVEAVNSYASLKSQVELMTTALEAAESELVELARPICAVFNRKTKAYEFNDEHIAGSLPTTFEVIKGIRSALSLEQEKTP